MDSLMWIVTFVALTLAVGMSVIAMRLFRGERQRSAARVAALEGAAYEFEEAADHDAADNIDAIDPIDPIDPIDAFREERIDYDVSRSSPMFSATDEPKAPPRRWAALAFVAIVMAACVGGAYALFEPATLDASGTAATPNPGTRTPEPRNPGTPEPQTLPIELLSLKHTIDGSTFSLTGLVQNPIAGGALPHVVAVVYLFDRDGSYFATGRADLEFRGMKPGEESPFTVKISGVSHVGRYRVGFRSDDGSVVAHVDKRGQATAGIMTEVK